MRKCFQSIRALTVVTVGMFISACGASQTRAQPALATMGTTNHARTIAGEQRTPADGDPTTASNRQAATEHYQQSREYYSNGQYRAAARELETAIALDPELANLHFNLGLLYERMGMLDRSVASYRRYEMLIDSEDERERTQRMIHRIEGARSEMAILRTRPGLADTAFWAVTASAIFAAVGGGVTLAGSIRTDARVGELMMMMAPPRDVEQTREIASVLHITADTLLISGAALGVTAVILYAARQGSPPDIPRCAIVPMLGPNSAGVVGTF